MLHNVQSRVFKPVNVKLVLNGDTFKIVVEDIRFKVMKDDEIYFTKEMANRLTLKLLGHLTKFGTPISRIADIVPVAIDESGKSFIVKTINNNGVKTDTPTIGALIENVVAPFSNIQSELS